MFGRGLKVGDIYADAHVNVDDKGFERFDRKVDSAHRKAAKPIRQDLGADVEERGFAEYDRRIRQAESQHGRIRADLGGDFDSRGFRQYEHALNKAKRDARAASVFKAHLGADFDESGFRNYTRALDRADQGHARFRRGAKDTEGGLISLASRLPLDKWGLIGGGAYAATPPVLALAGALGPILGLLGAIPGLAAGAGTALAAAFLGLHGVGDAMKAAWDQQNKSSATGAASAKRQEAATAGVKNAEQQLEDAHRSEREAQQELNQARQQAVRDLQDMRLAARRARTEEAGATLTLQRARAELGRLQVDPSATRQQLAEARQNVREAALGLRTARVERRRTAEDAQRADRLGIRAVPEYVAARKRVQDAERATRRATEDAAKAHHDAAQSMDQASGAANTLQQKMAALSPSGRRFVRFMQSEMFPAFRKLQGAAQEGLLPGVERGLQSALRNFPVLERVIGRFSRTLGDAAEREGRFFGQKATGRDLEVVLTRQAHLLDRSSQASIHFQRGLLDVAVAAKPLDEWLGKMALHLSRVFEGWARSGRESGRLEAFFKRSAETTQTTVHALWEFGKALVNIGSAGREAWGGDMLKNIDAAATALEKWTGSKEGRKELIDWFATWRKRWEEIGDAIGFITGRYRDLRKEGKSTSEALAITFSDAISKAIPIAIKAAGERSPEIASAFVQGFLAANVWGKLFIAGWFLKKLGGGRVIRGIGQGIAEDVALGFATRWDRSSARIRDALGRVFRRGGEGAASGAAEGVAGSYVGSLATRLRSRAGTVRDVVRRQLLAGRLIGAAAIDAAAATAGQYVTSMVGGLRSRVGRTRDVIRRYLLGGAAIGGAAEGGGAAVGGAFVGSMVGRMRNLRGRIRDILRRYVLGGAVAGGAAEGAGAAVGGTFVGSLADRLRRAGGRGGRIGSILRFGLLGGAVIGGLAEAAGIVVAATFIRSLGDRLWHSKNSITRIIGRILGGGFGEGGDVTGEGHILGLRQLPKAPQIKIPGLSRQGGGPVPPGAWSWVGETGMEILEDRGAAGSFVHPLNAGRTPTATVAGGGLGPELERERKRAKKPLTDISSDLLGLATAGRRAGSGAAKGVIDGLERGRVEGRKRSKRIDKDVGGDFTDLRRDTDKEMKRLSKSVSDELEDARKSATKSSSRLAKDVGTDLQQARAEATRQARRMSGDVVGEYGDMRAGARRHLQAIERGTNQDLGDAATAAHRQGTRIRQTVARSYESLDRAVQRGLGYVQSATSNALEALGASKAVNLHVQKPKGLFGGGVVDAPSLYDSAMYMLGRNERVLTQHQTADADALLVPAFGVTIDDLIHGNTRPNYAARGAVTAGPGHSGEGFNPIWNMARSKFSMSNFTGFDGHNKYSSSGNVSDHFKHMALDMSNGVLTPQEDALNAFFKRKVPEIVKQLIWRSVDQFNGYDIGDHLDHVHLAMPPQYAFDAGRTAKILSRAMRGLDYSALLRGGAGSATQDVDHVDRITVKGRGPLRGAAAGAIAKARTAANRKIDRMAAKLSPGQAGNRFGQVHHADWHGIDSVPEFERFWHKINPDLGGRWPGIFGGIVPRESSWNPRAGGPGSGNPTHAGWYQFDSPTYNSFGKGGWPAGAYDPVRATQAAGNVVRREGIGGVSARWAQTIGGAARGRAAGRHQVPKKGHQVPRGSVWRRWRERLRREYHRLRRAPHPDWHTLDLLWNLINLADFRDDYPSPEIRAVHHAARGRPGHKKPSIVQKVTPSPKWRKRTAGWSSAVDSIRKRIEHKGTEYDLAVRRADITEEEFIIEGDENTPPRLDLEAIAQREKELDKLIKIRTEALRLYDRLLAYIRKLVDAYRKLVARLERAIKTVKHRIDRLKGVKGTEAQRAREKARGELASLRGQLEGDDGARAKLTEWRDTLTDEGFEREGVAIDIDELKNEVAPLRGGGAGVKLPDFTPPGADAGGDTTGEASPADVAKAAAEQLAAFQAARAELFGNFGRNFVPAGQSLFPTETAQAAGMRFFGAASEGGPEGRRTVEERNVDITAHFNGQPPDPHLWVRRAGWEAEQAFG